MLDRKQSKKFTFKTFESFILSQNIFWPNEMFLKAYVLLFFLEKNWICFFGIDHCWSCFYLESVLKKQFLRILLTFSQNYSIHNSFHYKIRGKFLLLKFRQRRAVLKKLLRDRKLVERGDFLFFFSSFFFQKSSHYYWNTFVVWLIITLAVINRSILSYGLLLLENDRLRNFFSSYSHF